MSIPPGPDPNWFIRTPRKVWASVLAYGVVLQRIRSCGCRALPKPTVKDEPRRPVPVFPSSGVNTKMRQPAMQSLHLLAHCSEQGANTHPRGQGDNGESCGLQDRSVQIDRVRAQSGRKRCRPDGPLSCPRKVLERRSGGHDSPSQKKARSSG
jgi:hypothetical protein